ncbi:electron transporter RnfD [Saccharophagus degradans]|uniref:GDSL-type esterase/lipase family protein n=1 Tax=Saccharophagus degradans TaxID=86304 RepID=UPI001C08F5C2|nr:GDSL-type esterase/lipase family protein [Saccharophagus degradans]MBU2986492.1 electron transporter RnfD [Saccharophagus degradans]
MCLKINRWWAFVWLCICATIAHSETYVPADNDQYLYTGRIDFSDVKAPSLSWPGTSIKANFTGEHLEVVLDDQNGKNFFNVIIDGNDRFPYVLEAKQGEHRYLISSALSKGKHSVEIYKRTEGEEGATLFKGLWLADDSYLLTPPKRPKRRVEIYGDSITSGMGNEGANNGADHLGSEKNNYLAYGAITARNLNAELHTISQSGIGVMVSWFPFIMPQFYNQLSAVGNNDSIWDFKQWTPHVVVINLMQNDSWLIDREKRLTPIPTDAQRIAHYQAFVQSIRAEYPKAQIICALGSMDATANEKWPNYVREAVKNMQDNGDNKIDTIFFEYTGYGQHPRVAQHNANAEKLTKFIKKKMKW